MFAGANSVKYDILQKDYENRYGTDPCMSVAQHLDRISFLENISSLEEFAFHQHRPWALWRCQWSPLQSKSNHPGRREPYTGHPLHDCQGRSWKMQSLLPSETDALLSAQVVLARRLLPDLHASSRMFPTLGNSMHRRDFSSILGFHLRSLQCLAAIPKLESSIFIRVLFLYKTISAVAAIVERL
jgi:hypothetical protein